MARAPSPSETQRMRCGDGDWEPLYRDHLRAPEKLRANCELSPSQPCLTRWNGALSAFGSRHPRNPGYLGAA
jgi:hypothetical protein